MKTRVIVGNLLVTYILFPLIYVAEYWVNIFTKNYKYYDTYYSDLGSYLSRVFEGVFFWGTILLVATLIPLHLVKIKWLYRIRRNYILLSILCYIAINILFVILTGYGMLLLTKFSPWSEQVPFAVVLIGFSSLIQGVLYFLVDRYYRLK
jgi:hypothetical protein